jgi:hypothetical protein
VFVRGEKCRSLLRLKEDCCGIVVDGGCTIGMACIGGLRRPRVASDWNDGYR